MYWKTCPDCVGNGYTYEPGDDNPHYPRCGPCNGKGLVPVGEGTIIIENPDWAAEQYAQRRLREAREIERATGSEFGWIEDEGEFLRDTIAWFKTMLRAAAGEKA